MWFLGNKGTKRFIESKIVKSRLQSSHGYTKTEFATNYRIYTNYKYLISIYVLNFKKKTEDINIR